jgi:hypothetical protein
LLLRFGNALKADHLATPQRLEERLKGAADVAPKDRALDLHVADSRCTRHPLNGRPADKADLNVPNRLLVCHDGQARNGAAR